MAWPLRGKPNSEMARPRKGEPKERDPFAIALGANIKRARGTMTAKDLARQIGNYDPAQLSKVEGGLAVPRADVIAKIARVLDVSPADLYPGAIAARKPGSAAGAAETESRLPASLRDSLEALRTEVAAALEAARSAQATADEAKRLAQRRPPKIS